MTSRFPENPPKQPSRLDRMIAVVDRLREMRRRSLSWRVRCDRCGWVEEVGSQTDAASLEATHGRDHERKGITATIKVYPLPWWRRYLDSVDDSA